MELQSHQERPEFWRVRGLKRGGRSEALRLYRRIMDAGALAQARARALSLCSRFEFEILSNSQIARGCSNGDLVPSGIYSPLTGPRVKIRKGPAVEQKGCLL